MQEIQLLTSIGLFILIWVIQIVHYPLFKYLGTDGFSEAMKLHQDRISMIVIPLMIAELGSAIGLCFLKQDLLSYALMIIVTLIWLSTFFIQVPHHNSLSHQYEIEKINALVKSNWIRTGLWTLKMILNILFFND